MSCFPLAMDDLLLQTLVKQHWLETEGNQEIFDWLQLSAAFLVIGSVRATHSLQLSVLLRNLNDSFLLLLSVIVTR